MRKDAEFWLRDVERREESEVERGLLINQLSDDIEHLVKEGRISLDEAISMEATRMLGRRHDPFPVVQSGRSTNRVADALRVQIQYEGS